MNSVLTNQMLKTIHLRFYEELNDFLHTEKKEIRFERTFIDRTSVKDIIESLGVPHTEIDLIIVNGKSVDFNYIVNGGDDISVYPVFESFDISNVQHLRPKPLRDPKFILDVHLGRLAKHMRMLGFDSLYKNNFTEEEIISISLSEKRAILTRSSGLLKHREITHGYWLRNTNPTEQLKEVIERFQLSRLIKEFTRCLICNSIIEKIDKSKVEDRLPHKVKEWHAEFYFCEKCDKVYWKGTHYFKMKELINDMLN